VESVRSYLILGAIIAFALWVIRRRPEMEIRIEKGRPRVTRGRVPPSFLEEVAAIVEREQIDSGWIGSTLSGNPPRLTFSKSIPEWVRQQIRNVWLTRRRVEKPAW
jgi:hypothetical protein